MSDKERLNLAERSSIGIRVGADVAIRLHRSHGSEIAQHAILHSRGVAAERGRECRRRPHTHLKAGSSLGIGVAVGNVLDGLCEGAGVGAKEGAAVEL